MPGRVDKGGQLNRLHHHRIDLARQEDAHHAVGGDRDRRGGFVDLDDRDKPSALVRAEDQFAVYVEREVAGAGERSSLTDVVFDLDLEEPESFDHHVKFSICGPGGTLAEVDLRP